MSFSIRPTDTYTISQVRGYARAARTFSRRPAAASRFGLETFEALSGTSLTKAARTYRISALSQKTSRLHRELEAFVFPEGTLSRLFKSAAVSDESKATARAAADAQAAAYSLDIDWLAAAKTLQSRVLASDAPADINDGEHTFTLTVDDTDYELQVTVDTTGSAPDTNKDVLQRIARAVSGASPDIETAVVEGERRVYSPLSDGMSEDVSFLRMQARNTGTASDFSLSDSGSGSLVETLGLDRIALPAAAARYSLENSAAEADTNTVSADAGRLTITLLQTTGEPVTVSVEHGADTVEHAVTGLIASYNDYLGWLEQNSAVIKPALRNALLKEVRAVAWALEAVGLSPAETGEIRITEQFSKALQSRPQTVDTVLTGEDGLFTRIAAQLSRVITGGAQAYAVPQEDSVRYGSLSIFA